MEIVRGLLRLLCAGRRLNARFSDVFHRRYNLVHPDELLLARCGDLDRGIGRFRNSTFHQNVYSFTGLCGKL